MEMVSRSCCHITASANSASPAKFCPSPPWYSLPLPSSVVRFWMFLQPAVYTAKRNVRVRGECGEYIIGKTRFHNDSMIFDS